MYSLTPACSKTHSVVSPAAESEPLANVCRDTLMSNIKHTNQGSLADILGDGSSDTGVYFKEKWLRVSSLEIQEFKKPPHFLKVMI